MSCRIIREWIDACDDKHLEEVLDHIDLCPACQIYFDNKTNLEDQLKPLMVLMVILTLRKRTYY